MKAKKCKKCDCPSWSGGLCKNHIERKPMKTSTIKTGGRRVGKKQSQTRYELFMLIWKKRGPHSEVSGEKIFGEPSSAHFHHILPKSKYPEADLDPENIIIMTMDEHNNVENDMFKYDEVNRRRELLLKKYDLI
jgi:5-methylcytosine-specific restriction endonuclease McrA